MPAEMTAPIRPSPRARTVTVPEDDAAPISAWPTPELALLEGLRALQRTSTCVVDTADHHRPGLKGLCALQRRRTPSRAVAARSIVEKELAVARTLHKKLMVARIGEREGLELPQVFLKQPVPAPVTTSTPALLLGELIPGFQACQFADSWDQSAHSKSWLARAVSALVGERERVTAAGAPPLACALQRVAAGSENNSALSALWEYFGVDDATIMGLAELAETRLDSPGAVQRMLDASEQRVRTSESKAPRQSWKSHCPAEFRYLAAEHPNDLIGLLDRRALPPHLVSHAAEALQDVRTLTDSLRNVVLRLLQHPDPIVRERALLGVRPHLADARLFAAVSVMAESDEDDDVRDVAAMLRDDS